MAETRPEIETRLRAEHPAMTARVNTQTVTLDSAAYEARLAEWVDNELARQVADEAEAAERAFRQAVHERMVRLRQIADFTGASNNTQRDAAIKDIADSLHRLGRVLITRGIIEAEDE